MRHPVEIPGICRQLSRLRIDFNLKTELLLCVPVSRVYCASSCKNSVLEVKKSVDQGPEAEYVFSILPLYGSFISG